MKFTLYVFIYIYNFYLLHEIPKSRFFFPSQRANKLVCSYEGNSVGVSGVVLCLLLLIFFLLYPNLHISFCFYFKNFVAWTCFTFNIFFHIYILLFICFGAPTAACRTKLIFQNKIFITVLKKFFYIQRKKSK